MPTYTMTQGGGAPLLWRSFRASRRGRLRLLRLLIIEISSETSLGNQACPVVSGLGSNVVRVRSYGRLFVLLGISDDDPSALATTIRRVGSANHCCGRSFTGKKKMDSAGEGTNKLSGSPERDSASGFSIGWRRFRLAATPNLPAHFDDNSRTASRPADPRGNPDAKFKSGSAFFGMSLPQGSLADIAALHWA